jgi:hypothetical protein
VRWSHINVVEYLISNLQWNRKEIARAMTVNKEYENRIIKDMLAAYAKR